MKDIIKTINEHLNNLKAIRTYCALNQPLKCEEVGSCLKCEIMKAFNDEYQELKNKLNQI
jgi:hypothetical protein